MIRSEARLIEGRYAFSEAPGKPILDLRLYQLTGLEREKIDKPNTRSCSRRSKTCCDILAKESRVLAIIKEELREIREKHAHAAPDRIRP